jgi:hypothetical protein
MTPKATTVLPNRALRNALFSASALSAAPPGDPLSTISATAGATWVHETLRRLAYVQVDSIAAVERAHHHILFTRNRRYRHADLKRALEVDRTAFESWTHSHAVLPIESFPYWKHYFARARTFEAHPGYRRYFAPVTDRLRRRALEAIRERGPLRPRDIATEKVEWHDAYFAKPSLAKLTLEHLWRVGELAVTAREGQEKVYDLAAKVVPPEHHERTVSRAEFVDWACTRALERLVAATPSHLARFFDAVPLGEVRAWCREHAGGRVRDVAVECADGTVVGGMVALAPVLDRLDAFPDPPRELRVLSPFDPLVHDRGGRRTERIFGFDFRMEIWVPPSRRIYGYYVLPVVEGRRFVGRVDVKHERGEGALRVPGLWWEPGLSATPRRVAALRGRLLELARFVGAEEVVGLP